MSDTSETDHRGPTEHRPATTVSRRRYLAIGGAAIATAATAGCTDEGEEGQTNAQTTSRSGPTDTMTFVETPGNRPEATKKQWAPFVDYLESEVDGLTVETKWVQEYSAAGQALQTGQAEMTKGEIIVLASPDDFDILGISAENGAPAYFSFIVSRPEYDHVNDLTDLKGESIAFADPLSTSGSLFATYELLQAGIDIGDAPYGDPVDYEANFSNHDAVKQQLFNREDIVAGATYAGNIINHIPKEQIPDVVRENSSEWGDDVGTEEPEAQLLNASEPIPKEPLVLRSDWDSPLRDDVEKAVADIGPGTLAEPDGDVDLAITDIVDASFEDFQPVLDVIEALDVDIGDL